MEGTRKKPLVLVADDDITSRLLAREALEQGGFDVEEATDGRMAVARFESARPDLVLLDVEMPDFDGFGALEKICSVHRDVPVVMMTGNSDLESIRRAFELGAIDFVTKPINWLILTHRCRFLAKAADTLVELREAHSRVRSAQRLARLGTWQLDARSGEVHGTEELLRMFGLPQDRSSFPSGVMLDRIDPDDRERVIDEARQTLTQGRSCCINHRIQLPDGSRRVIRTSAEPIFDKEGRILWVSGSSQDITERARAEDQIRFLSQHDALTGLANRSLLTELAERALDSSSGSKETTAVFSLGLAEFERINESRGHQFGDHLLRLVAERLVGWLHGFEQIESARGPGPSPVIARVGGSEFALVLPRVEGVESVEVQAQRLLESLSDPFDIDATEVTTSAAIGIALWPSDGLDVETLLRNAGAAMDHVRREEKGGSRFFTQEINESALRRLSLENSLRRAIEHDELRLYYQPKIDAANGRLTSVEALIRWQHPEDGLLSPLEFIPLAEETGLIVPIGEWVLGEACRQHRAWREQGFGPVRVAANLSPLQLRSESVQGAILEALQRADMEPRYLELEITESALMADEEAAIRTLSAIQNEGVGIAIDDFGTGYSSLSYLTRFPIDTVKIDRSFIDGVESNPRSAAVTKAIISLAQALGLRVVAEGVENELQWRFLREHHCDEMQGFFFSRPVIAEALLGQVRSGRYPARLGASNPNANEKPEAT